MRLLISIIALLFFLSCQNGLDRDDVVSIIKETYGSSLAEMFPSGGDSLVRSAALRVKPVYAFDHYSVQDLTDSSAAMISQTYTNEAIIWYDTLQEALWIRIDDSIGSHLTLITNNADSITNHRSDINSVLDSILAHRTDIDNIDVDIPATGYTAFNDTLRFTASNYYQTFLATDSIQMTVDTAGQRWGEYTIARVNFGSGQVLMLPSPAFDTLQMYKVASGVYLSGVHMIYFENTPYGVAVSIPTNDSIQYLTTNPAAGIDGYTAEWDGKLGVTVNDTITTWVDQASSKSAANTTASSQPTWDGSKVTFDALDDMQFSAGAITTSGAHTWTIAVNQASNKDHILLGYTSSGFIMQRSAGNNTFLYNIGGLSFTSAHSTGNHIYQIVYDGTTTTTLYVDGVSAGTDSAPASRTFDMIGNRLPYGGQGLDGDVYYISYHTSAMDVGERTSMFNYINERFALGL